MIRILLTLLVAVTLFARPAAAQTVAPQEDAWVQIEAQPSLNRALEVARGYAARLPDVNGFALGSGWYAIALGPYSQEEASDLLRTLRARGQIPRDSYVGFTSNYRDRFYPVGGGALTQDAPVAPAPAQTVDTTTLEPQQPETPAVVEPEPEPAPVEETVWQARQSEQLLTRVEREELQIALRDAGHYNSTIDGAFGNGTRNAMASWQAAQGYEVTGVLTTRQREALLRSYYAILEGLDMQVVRDERAGIALKMPTAMVAFDRYEAPFVHFEATDGGPQKVVLISQAGTQDTLFGLYDILQTLAIVPVEGPRERGSSSFSIEGTNSEITTYVQATLQDGQIKGFILVWPVNDETRRQRMLQEMTPSFARLPGVLDAAAGNEAVQDIDLVSGLEIRRPELSQSGFFVDGAGRVVTAAAPLAACGRITLDYDHPARIVATDASGQIALLEPEERLAPIGVAAFAEGPARLQSAVAVAGYSYEGVLGAPTLTFGQLADVRGLDGEAGVSRLALETRPGDAGGPVLDERGAVVGMLLPAGDGTRQLPENVSFAVDGSALRAALTQAGVAVEASVASAAVPPEDLTTQATGLTALVSCWK
ncbi:trypsin-like peptidase domain-containing protein [Pseudooceanicola nanhaiensis]|uniref:trypsin-like peptidase domain-containing protein n=1 Tax=Pseudooceanicola nanhaiensis TaxID=375761 RepID=UPI001CD4D397|nr:trypsin-like peptidase domain-containing protein [Pseudooceanicola nanhaiensis]MCA0922106.1 trypsin-like peptidase domain-containing protein [Pseudooceanicola nanhaiensis]